MPEPYKGFWTRKTQRKQLLPSRKEILPMESLKQLKLRSILTSVLYICLGLVLIIFPWNVARSVSYVFSVMLLLIGGILTVLYFVNKNPSTANQRNFTTGLILIAASVYCLINIDFLIKILPVALGFTILINGLGKLVHVFDLLHAGSRRFLPVLIMAGGLITLGVLLLINPFGAGILFYIMTGIGFLLGGITDLITLLVVAKSISMRRQEEEAIDVTKDVYEK